MDGFGSGESWRGGGERAAQARDTRSLSGCTHQSPHPHVLRSFRACDFPPRGQGMITPAFWANPTCAWTSAELDGLDPWCARAQTR